jgi:hypothetical protein
MNSVPTDHNLPLPWEEAELGNSIGRTVEHKTVKWWRKLAFHCIIMAISLMPVPCTPANKPRNLAYQRPFNGPNRVGASHQFTWGWNEIQFLRQCSLGYGTMDNSKNSLILSVIHHNQNAYENSMATDYKQNEHNWFLPWKTIEQQAPHSLDIRRIPLLFLIVAWAEWGRHKRTSHFEMQWNFPPFWMALETAEGQEVTENSQQTYRVTTGIELWLQGKKRSV